MSVGKSRVIVRRGRVILPRHTVRCGCGCGARIVIVPDRDPDLLRRREATLEIGGVIATLEAWRKIFAPLLAEDVTTAS